MSKKRINLPIMPIAVVLVVILAVAQHISLSPEDIKGALTAIPLYLGLILILSVVCGLLGAK